MTMMLLAVIALVSGLLVRRWWLVTLPLAMGAGALLLMAMPGNSINPDNPLPFTILLLAVCLVAGVIAGRHTHRAQ
jgi:peptidoglycan/LPS O-acetylase OafA/YrhL